MMGSVLVRTHYSYVYIVVHIILTLVYNNAIGDSDEVTLIGFLKAPHYFQKGVTFPTHKET